MSECETPSGVIFIREASNLAACLRDLFLALANKICS
jgi:hypothetical protein